MIAISYRREDSQPVAGRLYDRLQARFGKQNVFMDFDSIPPGVDFREQIKRTIERSNLVIAVIGPRWLSEQSDGTRRIDDPTDFVRLEIKYALEKGIPVIPLLVDNTLMPKPGKLPPEIEGLAFRNALPLDSGIDFHNHAERLITGICGLVDVSEMEHDRPSHAVKTHSAAGASPVIPAGLPRRSKTLAWGAIALIVVVGAALGGWFLANNHREEINKRQDSVATHEPTPAGGAQPAQSLSIAPQPNSSSTASLQVPAALAASPVIEVSQSPAAPTTGQQPSNEKLARDLDIEWPTVFGLSSVDDPTKCLVEVTSGGSKDIFTQKTKVTKSRMHLEPANYDMITDRKTGETIQIFNDHKYYIISKSTEMQKIAENQKQEYYRVFGPKRWPPPRSTGRTVKISGHELEEFVCESKIGKYVWWISRELAPFIPLRSLSFDHRYDLQNPDFSSLPGIWVLLVSETRYPGDGGVGVTKSTRKLTSIGMERVADSEFEIPHGYQRR